MLNAIGKKRFCERRDMKSNFEKQIRIYHTTSNSNALSDETKIFEFQNGQITTI